MPPRTTRKTRSSTSSRRPSTALPEQLPSPEVLLGCFYEWSAAAYTDRPDEVVTRVREVLPQNLSKGRKRASEKDFVHHVGIVRWSATHGCLWFRQGVQNDTAWVIDPRRLTDELRARVVTEEPAAAPLNTHALSKPPMHAAG